MRRKPFLFISVIAVLAALLFGTASCSGPVPSPTPAGSPEPTQDVEVITAANLALGRPASGSDTYTEDVYADFAFDGDLTTKWAPKDQSNTFLEVELNGEQTVNSVVVYLSGTPKAYSLRYYHAGEWYDLYGTYTVFDENISLILRKRYDFENVTAEKLRISVDEGHICVAEMEAYCLSDDERKITYSAKNDYLAEDFFEKQAELGLIARLTNKMFMTDTAALSTDGAFERSDRFVLQNGIWNKTLDERKVFLTSLTHTAQNETDWQLRVGLGGQIYSVSGGFGQAVPSQKLKQEWIDSVMQATAISYTKHNPDSNQTTCLLLQSGSYLTNQDEVGTTFYSPMLACGGNDERKAYATVSWMQQAYGVNVNRSDLLVYTQIRDIGMGAAEVTYTYCNFGSGTYEDLSVPWNTVRLSALPDHVLGKTGGGYAKKNSTWAQAVNLSDTGGWAAAVQDASNAQSMALALVFGKNPVKKLGAREQWSDAIYSYGVQDEELVQNVVSRFKLQPGDVFSYKFYIVVGKLGETATLAAKLADKVEYGFKNFTTDDADRIAYYLKYDEETQQNVVVTNAENGTPLFYTYAQPISGSLPLFLMRDKETGKLFMTTEPYAYGAEEEFANPYETSDPKYVRYLGKKTVSVNKERVEYLALLGFVMQGSEIGTDGAYSTIAERVNDESFFPGIGALDRNVVVLTE